MLLAITKAVTCLICKGWEALSPFYCQVLLEFVSRKSVFEIAHIPAVSTHVSAPPHHIEVGGGGRTVQVYLADLSGALKGWRKVSRFLLPAKSGEGSCGPQKRYPLQEHRLPCPALLSSILCRVNLCPRSTRRVADTDA